jgi:hypothetical protein
MYKVNKVNFEMEKLNQSYDLEDDKDRQNQLERYYIGSEPYNNITIDQYTNYLRAIKKYLKKHPKIKNPIIHIASSKDQKPSKDSDRIGLESEFIEKIKSILDKPKLTYESFFKLLESAELLSTPNINRNENCGLKEVFFKSPIFEAINTNLKN